MNIKDYLESSDQTTKELADRVGLLPTSLFRFHSNVHSPSLLNAVKLHLASNGKITFEDLLCEKDKRKLKEWKKDR